MGIIELEGGTLSYKIVGSGSQKLLCFHGFGQRKDNLLPLATVLDKRYTLYLFDLFHHGESYFSDGKVVSNEYLKNIFTIFLTRYAVEKFSVLGYSIGAKIALTIVYLFPTNIKEIYLLSPDGIKQNLWYQVATSTMAGRKIFQVLLLKSGFLMKFVKALYNIKLLPKWLYKFIYLQLIKNENSERLFKTWTSFRELKFKAADLTIKINENHIAVLIFLGEYDRLLKKEDILPFARKIISCKLYTLQCGHSNLIEATSAYIKQSLI